MAYNNAPRISSYQSKDVRLLADANNRDKAGTKDVISLNGYYDIVNNRATGEGDWHFVKRDGTKLYPYTVPSTNIRGMYYWEDQDKLFIAYDASIAVLTASTGAFVSTLTPAGWSNATTEVGFTEFSYDSGVVNLVVSDGNLLITIDSANTVVVGSSVNLPTPHSPFISFLDGYIFTVKAGTGDIYNSDLNSPLAWTAGNFITAEMSPDNAIRVSRMNNYLIVLGSASIEYFWDAGIATGSPLQRNPTPIKFVGYLGGLVEYGNKIYFIGQKNNSTPEVYVLEDFKISSIDVPSIRRYVQPYTTFNGAIISYGGHEFYVITVGTITYTVDLETQIWTRLSYGATTTFPINYATNIPISGYGNCSVVFLVGTSTISYFEPSTYNDNNQGFSITCITDNQNFDNLHAKFMSRLLVYADKPTASALLSISTTDDDYQTFSSARTVDLSLVLPKLDRLGRFRRRAFKLEYTGNLPIRIHHLEVDFNIGIR